MSVLYSFLPAILSTIPLRHEYLVAFPFLIATFKAPPIDEFGPLFELPRKYLVAAPFLTAKFWSSFYVCQKNVAAFHFLAALFGPLLRTCQQYYY